MKGYDQGTKSHLLVQEGLLRTKANRSTSGGNSNVSLSTARPMGGQPTEGLELAELHAAKIFLLRDFVVTRKGRGRLKQEQNETEAQKQKNASEQLAKDEG